MIILFGIIFFHMLVIICSRISGKKGVPYIPTTVITVVLVLFVVFMMYTMEKPQP